MTKITVIICTRNRAIALDNSLRALDRAGATLPIGDLDVVLVDNGSTDDTQAVAGRWAAQTFLPHKIVLENRPGLSVARNTGLSLAGGDILVFTDDDCLVSPTYFQDLLAHFAADIGPAVRGGRVELGNAADLPLSIKLDRTRAVLDDRVHPGAFVLGCNMAMSAAVPKTIGRFDERFGAGGPLRSGEDSEFLYRAYKAGLLVEYVPDMVVHHHHGRRHLTDIAVLHDGYDYGTGGIYAKYMFSQPRLLKFFYWAARNYVQEFRGGPKFSESLGISHGTMMRANIRGFFRFLSLSLARRLGLQALRRRGDPTPQLIADGPGHARAADFG